MLVLCFGRAAEHHVTTREQITLQDPMDENFYFGSQFGLDERFPDGDVPRMGIDFDEVGSLAHILDIKSVSEFSLDTMVQLSVHNPWYHNSDESSYCMIPLLAIIT
jgi:cohesin complex subunit SCC1